MSEHEADSPTDRSNKMAKRSGPGRPGTPEGPKEPSDEAPSAANASDRSGAKHAVSIEELQRHVHTLSHLAWSQGLRFWPVDFELVPREKMVELGSYVLPDRFSHWTFGRDYAKMQKLHDLGLVDILEMVINTRPAKAYLVDANNLAEHQMVIAHVLAHVDLFANNMWFERTPTNVVQETRGHEARLRELGRTFGVDKVERALDRALSIQWHVDFWRHYQASRVVRRGAPSMHVDRDGQEEGTRLAPDVHVGAGEAPSDRSQQAGDAAAGMTPSDLEAGARAAPRPMAPPEREPRAPHRDVLEYLILHAPLSPLEREVLEIVREETLYFYPNAMTKIINEGWATFWHARLMREVLDFQDFDRFAAQHSRLMASQGINPYKLGSILFENIVEEGDAELGPGEGLRRAFEVRRFCDDVTLIRDHLTQKVVDRAGLFLYDEDEETGERTVRATSVDEIKDRILEDLEGLGRPSIAVVSGDAAYGGAGGVLLLRHEHDGRDLDLGYAGDVLEQVLGFWQAPVALDTVADGERIWLVHDGRNVIQTQPIDEGPRSEDTPPVDAIRRAAMDSHDSRRGSDSGRTRGRREQSTSRASGHPTSVARSSPPVGTVPSAPLRDKASDVQPPETTLRPGTLMPRETSLVPRHDPGRALRAPETDDRAPAVRRKRARKEEGNDPES